MPHGRSCALGTGRLALSGVGAVVAVGWIAVPSAMVPTTVVAFVVAGLVVAVGLASRPAAVAASSRTRTTEDAAGFAADDSAAVDPSMPGPVEATDWSFREDDADATTDGDDANESSDETEEDGTGDDPAEAGFEFGPELKAD